MVSTTRRSRWAAPACLAAALLVGACAAPPTTSSPSSSEPLVVGASMSLSGDFADLAQPAKKGYELWQDTVNAKGGLLGRKVSLKIVDDASSPTQVVTNYQNLITSDRVDLVFGPFSSLLTVPAANVASRYNYAFIEPSGGAPQVFDLHLRNLFFAQPAPIVSSGDVFADYILSLSADQRPQTAGYPTADNPFTSAIVARVRERLEAAGIRTVYSQTYAAETVDLSPVVTKLAAERPDLVVSGTGGADGVAEVKSMIQSHWTPKFLFFTGGPNSPTFSANVGAANANGIFSASDWLSEAKTAGNDEFVKAYTAKYGGTVADIDPASAEAFACGQLLELVAQRQGKIDNQSIVTALHNGTWPTVVGDLSWDANGSPLGGNFLVQWVGDRLVSVYPPGKASAGPIAKPAWVG